MAGLSAFKRSLQESLTPRTMASTQHVDPSVWATWAETNLPMKHAGGYDPSLRLCEPDVPDVVGIKYRVVEGIDPDTGMIIFATSFAFRSSISDLRTALLTMIERSEYTDGILVVGSNRPIVAWRTPDGLRYPTPCVVWAGVTVRESTAIQTSDLLENKKNREVTLLRVRCRRSTKVRIERAAQYESQLLGERNKPEPDSESHFGRKFNLSGFCLDAVIHKCEEIEAAWRAAEQFTGTPAGAK